MEKSRHWYVVYLNPDTIINLLGGWKRHEFVALPELTSAQTDDGETVPIPPDTEIVDVIYSWERRQFGFRLQHTSFPVTPDGEMSPVLRLGHVVLKMLSAKADIDNVIVVEKP